MVWPYGVKCNSAWLGLSYMLNLEKFKLSPYCVFSKCIRQSEIKNFIPIIHGDSHGHTNL